MREGDRYGSRKLSERELRLIDLCAQGLKNAEIGQIVGITEQSVKNHMRVIYDKLGLWSRLELALWHTARQAEKEAQ